MCVCVRERERRGEREGGREGEREREALDRHWCLMPPCAAIPRRILSAADTLCVTEW